MADSSFKILVINLERRPDRWRHMQDQLLQLGLEFERVDAIDEKAMPESPATADSAAVTAGEIACHLSHRACWQNLVDSGASHGLVLEDDVIMSRQLKDFLGSQHPFPDNADIVRLETRCNAVKVYWREPCHRNSLPLYRIAERTNGAAAYIVSRECAMRLLAQDMAARTPVDHLLFDPHGPLAGIVTAYQVIPGLCVQGDVLFSGAVPPMLISDLETERRIRINEAKRLTRNSPGRSHKLKRELRRIGRQVKNLPRWMDRRLLLGIKSMQVPFANHQAAARHSNLDRGQ